MKYQFKYHAEIPMSTSTDEFNSPVTSLDIYETQHKY